MPCVRGQAMFGNSSFDRVREMFDNQFEPDGADFLYRRSGKGEPIPVSAAERQAFITDFRRGLRTAMWTLIGGMIVMFGGMIAVVIVLDADVETSDINWAIYPILAVLFAVYLAIYWRAWTAPRRTLAARQPVGFALTREEARRRALAKLSYGRLFGGGAVLALMLYNISRENDILHGWGRLWLVFTVAIAAALAVQLLRKWHYGKTDAANYPD